MIKKRSREIVMLQCTPKEWEFYKSIILKLKNIAEQLAKDEIVVVSR